MSQLGVETRVSASERDGQTRLILSQRVGQASPKVEGIAYGVFIGAIMGIIGGIPIAAATDSFIMFLVALIAITLVTALVASPLIRRFDERWRDKKQRKLKDLAADVEQIFVDAAPQVEAAAPQVAAPASVTEPEAAASGRVDLDALPDEPASAEAPTRNRERS
jgi:hypothetical protein